ncbi:MAG TPA: adenylate/guanylate cyclase domain-containing protein [Candidatus Limnocylindrales bacterium]|nr:adenylate/guanylate cyclase domain-containing protein [Candidatus Limnocylindrales bacterium]HSG87488.1 adenylate/guanylate cyclase domain-containing protein [Candidatus Limnocylindrales bacterium]
MTCPTCSAANPAGAKFCVECGTRLAAACPSCGATTNPPGARFCAECGTRLDGGSAAVGSVSPAGPAGASAPAPVTLGEPGPFQPVEPQTERRLVTVLFADLVGFTTRADSADPEQVREFLSRYFELCQETVERYGGTVEKFIGDAVMALWGAPVAREDDAERAVRAALELVDAVRHLGKREGDETLQVRAGVLTGEAAVAIGATNQGMVAGDLVNTASRLQSVAPPGTVLVGEATRRVASGAIAFEAAGEQILKGKPAPVEAFRALRVVAERGGTGRSEGIEAPFVGRDDELRLIKDFLHATSRERRVRLLSVTGQGGIGKSRLAWEFLKYIDGVEEDIFWHQGRSPSFGEGVTFWALGEMVRRRAGLAETDDDATTLERIAATVAEFVPDEGERRRIEPALRSLLGLGDAPPGGREELFAAWRTFFERISLQGTTVLVFEDLQWADAGLLDFIDHVLEWSIGYPILVITLARPDLIERRPDWGAGRRNFVALALQPLSDDAMRELLDGLVPGLPSSAVRTILQRADGMPLYAVETIRMLVEDGKLAEADGIYEVTGDLGELQIPDTLHALIAARLDAVDPSDRALLQDGAVLGQTFSVAALAALTGEPEAALEPRLRALVHREILQLDTDPRSPERGQYGFTQALVREVAYSTLAKRDRRTRHLAAARYYESLGDEAAAGVLAMHYVDAYEAAPEGAEGEAVAAQARIALRGAADRATALGSHESALAYLERARAVTSDPSEEAALLESLGTEARQAGRHEAAIKSFTEAVGRHRALGDLRSAARATTGLAIAQYAVGRFAEPIALLEAAEPEVAHLAPDPVVVDLWIALAHLAGTDQEARLRWADRALADAEALGLVQSVVEGLGQKGIALSLIGRPLEARALLEASLRMATDAGLAAESARAAFQLALILIDPDPRASVAASRQAVDLTRRYGMGPLRLATLMNAVEAALRVGDWAWLDEELEAVPLDELEPSDRAGVQLGRMELAAMLGRESAPLEVEVTDFVAASDDPGLKAAVDLAAAIVRATEGRHEEALRHSLAVVDDPLNARQALVIAARSAIRLGDLLQARAILDRLVALPNRGPAVAADSEAIRAAVVGLESWGPESSTAFRDAWRRYRDLGMDIALAASMLDCLALAPDGDPLATEAAREARAILERAGAVAQLVQLDALEGRRGTADVPAGRSRPTATGSARDAEVGASAEPG